MSAKEATHYLKSRTSGTASGLYYQDGDVLRPIIATTEGRLINIPVCWTNNNALEIFKLVEGVSE
ncbi:hypothetical protein D3C85_1572420 [compost metagenome]